ncbi:hypothetical protein LTR09_001385 [Extremus antarcticus]|uniref:Uncharacterized protein n=1 Tax=Extremus antarcticus TaxID=702011 RepID=A0AAJ0GIN4_9PEZI|nr:hypothetical protein LTR09_001385 [Extremus antarcticus]
MDLDTTFELLFGLIATILALLALWFTYKHKDDILAKIEQWRHRPNDLPSYHSPRSSSNYQRLQYRQRRVLYEETFHDVLANAPSAFGLDDNGRNRPSYIGSGSNGRAWDLDDRPGSGGLR